MTDETMTMADHLSNLEAENEKFRAEIERLKDLQSPGHDRLERIATAAMQGILSGPADLRYIPAGVAIHAVEHARALIAELDGEAGE